MNAQDIVNVQTLESQAFALAARLHVILRREKGRVTDIEYMAQNAAYCRYVLGLGGSAESVDAPALCSRLEELYLGPYGVFIRKYPPPAAPLPVATSDVARARTLPKDQYVGRLR
jgi:hypothetical protein